MLGMIATIAGSYFLGAIITFKVWCKLSPPIRIRILETIKFDIESKIARENYKAICPEIMGVKWPWLSTDGLWYKLDDGSFIFNPMTRGFGNRSQYRSITQTMAFCLTCWWGIIIANAIFYAAVIMLNITTDSVSWLANSLSPIKAQKVIQESVKDTYQEIAEKEVENILAESSNGQTS